MPPLVRLEQQLAAEIGPPHNYKGFPQGYPQGATAAANSTAAAAASTAAAGPGSSEPQAAASEQNLPAGTAAAAAAGANANAGVGAVSVKVSAGVGASALHRVNTAAASVSGRSVLEGLLPDMAELKEVAEVRRATAFCWCNIAAAQYSTV